MWGADRGFGEEETRALGWVCATLPGARSQARLSGSLAQAATQGASTALWSSHPPKLLLPSTDASPGPTRRRRCILTALAAGGSFASTQARWLCEGRALVPPGGWLSPVVWRSQGPSGSSRLGRGTPPFYPLWFSLVAQLCPTLRDSVHGTLQARILEWVDISSSRGPSHPGIDPTSPLSPALQADSLSAEPARKPPFLLWSHQIY